MRQLCLFLLLLFLTTNVSMADSIVLNAPEALETPEAYSMDWEIIRIDAENKFMRVKYRWLDSNGKAIHSGRTGVDHYWTCMNQWSDTNPVNNDQCISAGVPDPCCTGEGQGTCDDTVQTDSCFSDVFGFQIRQQDVGTAIGNGLRQLVWNQMKQDILSPGNDGDFQ